jgi:hypothetical protein
MTFKLRVTVTEISTATTTVDAPDLDTAKDIAEDRARNGALLYTPAPVVTIEVEEAPAHG